MKHHIIKAIKVASKGQKRQEGSTSQQPRLQRMADDYDAKHKEEAYNRAKINGSTSERLIAPIGLGLYRCANLCPILLHFFIQLRVAIQRSSAATAVGVGNEHSQ